MVYLEAEAAERAGSHITAWMSPPSQLTPAGTFRKWEFSSRISLLKSCREDKDNTQIMGLILSSPTLASCVTPGKSRLCFNSLHSWKGDQTKLLPALPSWIWNVNSAGWEALQGLFCCNTWYKCNTSLLCTLQTCMHTITWGYHHSRVVMRSSYLLGEKNFMFKQLNQLTPLRNFVVAFSFSSSGYESTCELTEAFSKVSRFNRYKFDRQVKRKTRGKLFKGLFLDLHMIILTSREVCWHD